MDFDPSRLLRKATGRAKSDVANKLVSMLLHELSRRITLSSGLSVNGEVYSRLATEFFGQNCPYCGRGLVARHVAVEHLDGMNRRRAGLHIPGNVVLSCSDCNREKRRDDQAVELKLAESGWESFLSHDSTRCVQSCNLALSRERILEFRRTPAIAAAIEASLEAQGSVKNVLESFYREGQLYAQTKIAELAESVLTVR